MAAEKACALSPTMFCTLMLQHAPSPLAHPAGIGLHRSQWAMAAPARTMFTNTATEYSAARTGRGDCRRSSVQASEVLLHAAAVRATLRATLSSRSSADGPAGGADVWRRPAPRASSRDVIAV